MVPWTICQLGLCTFINWEALRRPWDILQCQSVTWPEVTFNVKSFEGPLLTAEEAESHYYMSPKTKARLKLPDITSRTLLWGQAGLREVCEGDWFEARYVSTCVLLTHVSNYLISSSSSVCHRRGRTPSSRHSRHISCHFAKWVFKSHKWYRDFWDKGGLSQPPLWTYGLALIHIHYPRCCI